jgi:hypothetical protein
MSRILEQEEAESLEQQIEILQRDFKRMHHAFENCEDDEEEESLERDYKVGPQPFPPRTIRKD